jgi:hypothetical protein
MAIGVTTRLGLLTSAVRLHRWERAGRHRLIASVGSFHARRTTSFDPVTHRWVMTGPTTTLCRVERSTSSQRVMTDNLMMALDVLGTAEIPLFFVPLESPTFFRIGVPIDHRQRAWQAFVDFDLPPETVVEPTGKHWRTATPAASSDFERNDDRLLDAPSWRVYRPVTDPTAATMLGATYGCEIEFWTSDVDGDRATTAPSVLRAQHRNSVAPALRLDSVTESSVEVAQRRIPTSTAFARAHADSSTWFPIDVVYTWVDDTDPAWLDRFTAAREHSGLLGHDAATSNRYVNRDELRYSLRSLHHFADFVRHIYVVTDQQVPSWLDTDAPGLTIVDHREIFGDDGMLPTFNSHAIESCLHRIDGLSDHYLYLNDDVFFGRRVTPSIFFHKSGLTRFFLSRAQIPSHAAAPNELSVDCAARNGRELVWQEFGAWPTQKFKHTPHAQRRDVLLEIERRFGDPVKEVRNAQFRSPIDISMASSLHHHVGSALGLAVAGSIRYEYVQLTGENLAGRLERVANGTYDTFCLNDVASDAANRREIDGIIQAFFDRTFPWPSPWERPPNE